MAGCHAEPFADACANPDTFSNPNPNAYAYTYANPNAFANPNAYADSDALSNPNASSDGHAYADSYPHSFSLAYAGFALRAFL